MTKVWYIPCNTEVKDEVIEIEPTLNNLQTLVGGYIEIIPISKKQSLVVNEEGLLLNLPRNNLVTALTNRNIVGNVVVIDNKDLN